MSGEPVEAAEDTSGVEAGVKVGEEVADVCVGGETTGEAAHVMGEQLGVSLVSEGASESAHAMGKQLGVSLLVVGKQPDVSLMMIPDDGPC